MDILIGGFAQNETEEVRVHLKKLKGRDLLDIRTYASLKLGAEKIPTGRGISIDLRQWEDFKKMIIKTETQLRNTL